MLHEIVHLNKYYNFENDPCIEITVPFNKVNMTREKSKAIIVVPGGAYTVVSGTEADPVALSYMLEGFIAIILHYSVKTPYPTPMKELACAIDYIRKNSDKYYIDKNKITVIGFSAGGHLTASYGYLYKHPDFVNTVNLSPENIKPNCIVLSYPVISMGEYSHKDTRKNITGDNENLYNLLSAEKNIDSTYPPTFIWTTKEDKSVSYINSVLFVDALKENNVKHEFFLYPYLNHALSVINPLMYSQEILQDEKMQEVSKWFIKSVNFIRETLDK